MFSKRLCLVFFPEHFDLLLKPVLHSSNLLSASKKMQNTATPQSTAWLHFILYDILGLAAESDSHNSQCSAYGDGSPWPKAVHQPR